MIQLHLIAQIILPKLPVSVNVYKQILDHCQSLDQSHHATNSPIKRCIRVYTDDL